MPPPTFRDLTFDELLGRGWQVQIGSPAQQPDGTWRLTLILPGPEDMIIHAVTGQGQTGDEAQAKAIEIANVWRRMQAKARRREEGQANQ